MSREADLLKLAAALKGDEMVTVGQIAAATGLGGSGKTQLAGAFVHHYSSFFAEGVHWLSFADPNAIPTEIVACGATLPERRADFATLETQVRLALNTLDCTHSIERRRRFRPGLAATAPLLSQIVFEQRLGSAHPYTLSCGARRPPALPSIRRGGG